MGIRKEINDMIIERGGTPPVNGGIAASIDALSKLLNVGGGSGGGVSSWNDLTDKPFGEEGGGVIADADITLTSLNVVQSGAVFSGVAPLVEGETYKLTVFFPDAGDEYYNVSDEFVATAEDGEDGLYLGSWYYGSMRVWCRSSGNYELVNNSGNTISGHVTIEAPQTIKTLDPKYLPESVKTLDLVFDVETVSEKYWDEDGTEVLEILDAVKSGKNVRFIVAKNELPMAIMPFVGYCEDTYELVFATVLPYDQNGIPQDSPYYYHRAFVSTGAFTNYSAIALPWNS